MADLGVEAAPEKATARSEAPAVKAADSPVSLPVVEEAAVAVGAGEQKTPAAKHGDGSPAFPAMPLLD